jgi:hypothetical protein
MLPGTQFETNQKTWVAGVCAGKVPITSHTMEALDRRKTLLKKQLHNERARLDKDLTRIDEDLDYAAIGLETRMLHSSRVISDLATQLLELNETRDFVASYLENVPAS